MSEMVTRCAEALRKAAKGDMFHYLRCDPYMCEAFARVLIEAMRLPTEYMVECAVESDPYAPLTNMTAENVWRIMIDAALKV